MQFLAPFLQSGWYIAMVILGLGLIIFLHELGHFLMAKKNKVRVEVFSLGFGPVLWRTRRGDTEYRVSALPLGGFVKMAGEGIVSTHGGEPWELGSKSPWQRFQIFVAGALVNLIIAFPIGMMAYWFGKYEIMNVVGTPGYAEALAGMKPGDVVVEAGDRRIESLDKLFAEMIRRPRGSVVPVTVIRDGQEKTLDVTVRGSAYHRTRPVTNVVGELPEGAPLHAAGLRPNDQVTAVDGEPVMFAHQLLEKLKARAGKEAVLDVRRYENDWSFETTQVRMALPTQAVHTFPYDERLNEPIVGSVANGSSAWEVLQPGDRIVKLGDREIRSWKDLREAVEPSAGQPLEIKLLRDGKEVVDRITPGYGPGTGKGALGITMKGSHVFAEVPEDSAYFKAGLRAGDVLEAVGGKSKELVPMGGFTAYGGKEPQTLKLQVARGPEKKLQTVELKSEPSTTLDLVATGLAGPKDELRLQEAQLFHRRDFAAATREGLYEPVDIGVMTFEILRKLVTAEESSRGLSGPVGIIQVTYRSAELSFGNYLWLLCLITVNLGVFNLLPIPVLDGGHNLLLLIEVIRKWFGKPPPSEKFVMTFQYVGLLFILFLFVFVTYNDISRIFGGG